MATAKRRALDHLRRDRMLARKHQIVAWDMEAGAAGHARSRCLDLDDEIGDELLRLVFTACHPLLSREARAALALRMICGLTTEEIARAFLLSDATIAQRIVRAKRTLSESGLSYETPRGEQLSERLASVLEVVYLIFNEGYTAARGEDLLRPQLCEEAFRMGRVLTSIAPHEPEAHGLLALMELNASRTAARTDASRRTDSVARSESLALGPAPDPPRHAGARAGTRAWAARVVFTSCRPPLLPATRRQPRRMIPTGRESPRLYAAPGGAGALAGDRTQPCSRGWHGRRPGAGLAIVDRLVHEPTLKNLSPAAERSRRSAAQARPLTKRRVPTFEAAAMLAGNHREQELLKRRAAEAALAAMSS